MTAPAGMSPPDQAPPRRERPAGERRRRNGRAAVTAAQRRELVRNRLVESRLTPNAISLTGLALNVLAAVLVWERLFFLGGLAFVIGSIMDTLDGRYSRMSGKGTPFGAFLDSTLDRLGEGIVLIAVGAYFASKKNQVAAAAPLAAVLGSLMVSYTRARAEALGVECKVGLATRPVRVVILSIGLIFAKGAGIGHFELLAPAVYVLAALTVLTTLQRIFHVRRQLKAIGQQPAGRRFFCVTNSLAGIICSGPGLEPAVGWIKDLERQPHTVSTTNGSTNGAARY